MSQKNITFASAITKLYIVHSKQRVALSHGVMVAQQVLVLFDKVRVLMGQRKEIATIIYDGCNLFVFILRLHYKFLKTQVCI